MNSESYRFEKIQYSDGFFSSGVDATYIIHLEGNGRLPEIQKQLDEYHPTNIVYIVYNKGYKKSKKQHYITNSARDIIDANLQIFKHAELEGYDNILILEDDFIFSEKVKEKRHQDNVLHFLNKNKEKPFVYMIGGCPIVITPYDFNNNYRGIFAPATHSLIFNKLIRNKILKDDQENIKDWDGHININYFFYKYIYGIPLCYQTITVTENCKNWGEEYGYFIKMLCSFGFKMTELFNMDKNPEPGFTICYIFSKCLFLFLFLFMCCFIFLRIFNKTVPNFTETAIIENKITFDETK